LATVVTVHGTYAHIVGPPSSPAPADLQWWQDGSPCEQHVRQLVAADDGNLEFKAFTWSGENSEEARRQAGSELLKTLRKLEERKQSYCVVGHSHGGSVIAAALVESVARRRPLDGLKRWITVGTPFVAMRKELFLFSRLTLPRKVLLVASLMLLMMFLVYVGGQLYAGTLFGRHGNQLWRFVFSATMMSLPFIFFYTVFWILDARSLYAYRPKLADRVEQRYGGKWLSLTHEDDEAVQGLKLLPRVKLRFFQGSFATPALTLFSIFALPLIYVLIVTSPTAMTTIAELLRDKVYDVSQYKQADAEVDAARQQFRALRAKLQQARATAESGGLDATRTESARQEAEAARKQLSDLRKSLLQAHPELPKIMRAQRFKRQFLEEKGKPCDGGTLCEGGQNYALNAALLFHLVTDELANAFVDQDARWGPLGGFLRLLLPAVLVPVIFALLAIGLLILIRFIAGYASAGISRVLNHMTHFEITRSALGNDTEGEIVVGSDARPTWMTSSFPFLPLAVGSKISDYSNEMSFQSLAKFRNAISTLAFSVDEEGAEGILTTYLTWRELIHTSYFEVAEFRKLLAYAIAEVEGFKAADAFKADSDFDRAKSWYGALQLQPVSA
jgi:hypothetical protein